MLYNTVCKGMSPAPPTIRDGQPGIAKEPYFPGDSVRLEKMHAYQSGARCYTVFRSEASGMDKLPGAAEASGSLAGYSFTEAQTPGCTAHAGPGGSPGDAPEAELDSQGKGQAAEAAAALASSPSLDQNGYGG